MRPHSKIAYLPVGAEREPERRPKADVFIALLALGCFVAVGLQAVITNHPMIAWVAGVSAGFFGAAFVASCARGQR